MKRFLFLVALLVASMQVTWGITPIKEGHMISGHVIEKGTEEDIPYATILIVGTDKGTVSNEADSFNSRIFRKEPTRYVSQLWAIRHSKKDCRSQRLYCSSAFPPARASRNGR